MAITPGEIEFPFVRIHSKVFCMYLVVEMENRLNWLAMDIDLLARKRQTEMSDRLKNFNP